jgi:uncharacterized membrane protein
VTTCVSCGTHYEGSFCPNCGARAGAGDPPRPASSPFGGAGAAGIPANWASVICYAVPVIGPLVFLLLAPYNADRKIRFDAWQALFLHLAFIFAGAVISVFYDVSWRLADLLHVVLRLAFIAIVVFMAVKCLQGEKVVLPVIGPLAEKQK